MEINRANILHSDFFPPPLGFLRPDVILHVYERWKNNTHEEIACRQFSYGQGVPKSPFVVLGLRACMDYLINWRLRDSDIHFLRHLVSLRKIESGFWEYLTGLKLDGRIWAVPEGEVIGHLPIMNSDSVKAAAGDRDIPFPIFTIEAPAAFIELVSEAIAAFLDYQISYSQRILKSSLAGDPPMYWLSEREGHLFWGQLASINEATLGACSILEYDGTPELYLFWDIEVPTAAAQVIYNKAYSLHRLKVTLLFERRMPL